MKIGIFLPDEKPISGGTSTMLSGILAEIEKANYTYQFCVVYRGKIFENYKNNNNNIEYININKYKLRVFLCYWLVQLRYNLKDFRERLLMRVPTNSKASYFDMLAHKENIDLFWFTMPVCEILATPYIYTVWDLGHRDLPMFPEMCHSTYEWNAREKIYQTMLPRASFILTGNSVGKKSLVQNYHVSENRVRIVDFMTPNLLKVKATKPSFMIPNDYYYYPAQFWAHKNHILILEALKILKEEYDIEANVVFTGYDYGIREYIHDCAQKFGLEKQVLFLGFVSLGEVKYLYQNAKALIYPSLLGPNNLPPLEAISMGIPVLVSDLEGHKEQLGDAAVYFDRYDSKKLAEAMISLANEDIRSKLLDNERAFVEKRKDYRYTDAVMNIVKEFERDLKRWKDT